LSMPKIGRFLIFALFTVYCPNTFAQYFYVDLSDSSRQIVLNGNGIAIGDILMRVKYCDKSSDYICFSSKAFKFAVLRNLGDKKYWTYDGATYKASRKEKLSLLGEIMEVIYIRSTTQNGAITFLYSQERGVFSFAFSGKNAHVYMLEGACGFAAKESCKNGD
jgi:hypothetical protein